MDGRISGAAGRPATSAAIPDTFCTLKPPFMLLATPRRHGSGGSARPCDEDHLVDNGPASITPGARGVRDLVLRRTIPIAWPRRREHDPATIVGTAGRR